jgi:hypothetical protein
VILLAEGRQMPGLKTQKVFHTIKLHHTDGTQFTYSKMTNGMRLLGDIHHQRAGK